MAARRLRSVSFTAVRAGCALLSLFVCGAAFAQEATPEPESAGTSSFLRFAQGMIGQISLQELLVWLVVGGIAGTFAAGVVTFRRDGFGGFTNLVIGLVGAILGGLLFQLLRWNLALGEITIHYEDLAAALFGSMVLLLCAWWLRVRWHPRRRRA